MRIEIVEEKFAWLPTRVYRFPHTPAISAGFTIWLQPYKVVAIYDVKHSKCICDYIKINMIGIENG